MNKLFLVVLLLLAAPLQAQDTDNELAVITNFCDFGPPVVCQIEADSIMNPRTLRELEVVMLEFSNVGTTKEMQAADSLMGEIIWRVEFIAGINEKYGGDNTAINRLILRLKRAQTWVHNDVREFSQEAELWDRKWSDRSVDLLMFSNYKA